MEIRTQFSVMFSEKNTSPKDLVEKLINHGYIDTRESAPLGKWFRNEVLPWLQHVTEKNQSTTSMILPPIWDKVYPEVTVSTDGNQFTVHCACGEDWPSPFHATSFMHHEEKKTPCENGDLKYDIPSVMSYRLVDRVMTDEPIFVIKARDPSAPRFLADWAVQRMAGTKYDKSENSRARAEVKARSALKVADDMLRWKKENPFYGVIDYYGRPNEWTIAHRLGHLLTDAARVGVMVTVENKVDPLTGRGVPVFDYRRKRMQDGNYPAHDLGAFVVMMTMKDFGPAGRESVFAELGKDVSLKAMAVPDIRFIPWELEEVDKTQA